MGGGVHTTGRGFPAGTGHGCDDDERVLKWEEGLPSGGDLAPLSQTLITPELASAFGITPEPPRTSQDVCRASSDTITSLRRQASSSPSSSSDLVLGMLPSFSAAVPAAAPEDPVVTEGDESGSEEDGGGCYSDKVRRLDPVEEADSTVGMENPNLDGSVRAQKRPRLVWTSQLHKRFVDVVAYLGIKNAVPKTIMHLMNVEGLTRENVASHLQKYRLYLKRNEGLSNDHLVTSTPVPQSLRETPVPLSMPYAAPPSVVQMPVLGMAQNGPAAHVTVVPVNGQHCAVAYQGFEAHHPYAVFEERRMDFPGGNKFCPMVPYPRVSPKDR